MLIRFGLSNSGDNQLNPASLISRNVRGETDRCLKITIVLWKN